MLSPPNKILLTGFSGSGKSTVLKYLGALCPEWTTVDLDHVVVQDHVSIASIVNTLGWDEFRKIEKNKLSELLARKEKMIISLGGGSLELGQALIESQLDAVTVHLKASFETCWERIQNEAATRPLVLKGEAFMRELYDKRLPNYQKADFSIESKGPQGELALAILQLVGLA